MTREGVPITSAEAEQTDVGNGAVQGSLGLDFYKSL